MARILVTDDERDAAEALGMVMRAQGHEVNVVCSGEAAVEMALDFHPDFLIIDYLLSDDVSGCSIARQLCATDPHLIVIVMTGLPEADIRAGVRALGFEFVPKPIDVDVLLELVERLGAPKGRAPSG